MPEFLNSPIPAGFIIFISSILAIATSRRVKAIEDQIESLAVRQIMFGITLAERGVIEPDDLIPLVTPIKATAEESTIEQLLKSLG